MRVIVAQPGCRRHPDCRALIPDEDSRLMVLLLLKSRSRVWIAFSAHQSSTNTESSHQIPNPASQKKSIAEKYSPAER